jgi:tetratricopeptide (TPR) repeat protein
VLVATFENRTGDPSLAGVGAMAADWITEGVAQTGLVPIVDARTAHLAQTRVPGTSVNNDSSGRIRSLAEETGAGTVVWGSYYRVGDSLVFQARISDANRGEIRRVLDPVRGPLADPTRAVDLLRDRAMGALATLFNYRESDWIAQSGTPPRYEAYQAFMEGTDLAVQFKEKEALARFARARELDSTFAQPVLWTAESYIVLQDWAHADSFLSLAQARRERYSPFDRAFLTNLQAELDGEWEAALRAAEEMARLAPGSEASVVVGQEAEALNRPREAIRAFRSVDPDRGWLRGWSGYWGWAMYAYHEVGLDREALALAQQARTRYPNLEDGLLYEIVALSAPGAEREIVADLDLAMTLPTTDNFGPVETFGFAIMELRAHGHPDLAYRVTQKAASWLRASNRTEVAGSPVGLARLYALCGEPDQARAILEKAARATPADVEIEGSLGVLAESRGDRAEADRIAAVLAGDTRRYLYGKPYFWRARMAAARGDKEAAVQLLREAFAHGYRYSWAFHLTPEFQGLRDYPPFEDIARAKG